MPERTRHERDDSERAEQRPVCRHTAEIIPLGTRLDRPHRWRPWIARWTTLYLCDSCDAILAVPAAGPTTGSGQPWAGGRLQTAS